MSNHPDNLHPTPDEPRDEAPRPDNKLQLYRPGRDLPAVWQPRPRADDEDEPAISLDMYLRVLRRRKWLMISVAATVVALTVVHTFTATPLFRAVVTLQVDPEDAKILPFEELGTQGSSLATEEYLWTQAEKLRSGDLAGSVIERLNLAEEPAFTQPIRRGALIDMLGLPSKGVSAILGSSSEKPAEMRGLVGSFLGRLDVSPLRNTRLIRVSFEAPDPELAARIANSVPQQFIEQHLESKFDSTTLASEFLQRQLDSLKIQVERSEEALLGYAQAKNIVNLSDRGTTARKRLADLTDELTLMQTSLIQSTALADAAAKATPSSLPPGLVSETIQRLESKKSELAQELAGLSESHGQAWPPVKELRLRIADLDLQLDREKRRALRSVAQDYEFARDRYRKVAAAVAEQRALVDRLNQDSIQYNILKREADSNKELYEGLLQRLKEAGVEAGLRSSNIQVTDRAEAPRSAASPRKRRSLGLGLFLGLFLGVGAALLVENLDNTLKTADDVTQYLGLAGLGVVPHLDAKGNGRRRWPVWRRAKYMPSKPILEQEVGPDTRGAAREAYRSLRTALMLSHSDRPPQVVLVTSGLPGEGKTTTVANLAAALAATGERTLMLDADLRKPALAGAFGLTFDQGLTTCLSGTSNLSSQIRELDYSNLYLVSAGPVAPNPPELLGSTRMAQTLEILREHFTYIVIDSPPVLKLTDASVLARGVDGIILIARAGKTPRAAVQRTAGQLSRVGGHILGVVLNCTSGTDGEYGYGYGYGYRDYLREPPAEPGPSKKTV